MDIYGKIREKIKTISGASRSFVFTGIVKSVSGQSCSVEIEGLTVTDVRLRAVVNDSKEQLLIIPRVGSYVLVVDLTGDLRNLAVFACSEIDRVNLSIGKTNIVIDNSGTQMEGQNENLSTVLSDFIDEVAKIIVVQGTSPNVSALNTIKQRMKKILK